MVKLSISSRGLSMVVAAGLVACSGSATPSVSDDAGAGSALDGSGLPRDSGTGTPGIPSDGSASPDVGPGPGLPGDASPGADGSSPLVDGGLPCLGPSGCGGATAQCCANIVTGAGTVPNCPVQSITSMCVGACVTKLQLSCGTTETVRLCEAAADCASDAQNPNCCTFGAGGMSQTFCVSGLVKQLGSPTSCK